MNRVSGHGWWKNIQKQVSGHGDSQTEPLGGTSFNLVLLQLPPPLSVGLWPCAVDLLSIAAFRFML